MAAAIATLLHKDFRTRMWFSEHVTENKQPNEKLKAKSVDMTSCLLTLQPPSFFAKKASEDNLKRGCKRNYPKTNLNQRTKLQLVEYRSRLDFLINFHSLNISS